MQKKMEFQVQMKHFNSQFSTNFSLNLLNLIPISLIDTQMVDCMCVTSPIKQLRNIEYIALRGSSEKNPNKTGSDDGSTRSTHP